MDFKKISRAIKFWWQRQTRGWDDSETFSLDYSIAKLVLPRLKRFKEFKVNNTKVSRKYRRDLDKMIDAFEWYASDDRWKQNEFEMMKKHQEGLDLFAKYYGGLWW